MQEKPPICLATCASSRTGIAKNLKESQAYPEKFGKTVALYHLDHMKAEAVIPGLFLASVCVLQFLSLTSITIPRDVWRLALARLYAELSTIPTVTSLGHWLWHRLV